METAREKPLGNVVMFHQLIWLQLRQIESVSSVIIIY